MLHVYSEALQAGNQDLLLSVIQHVLGVEDGWRVELIGSHGRFLFQVLVREDSVQMITEGRVVNKACIVRKGEVVLKTLVLLRCEVDALSMESASELLCGQVALSERVVVLEELVDPDPILFHNLFDFHHEWLDRSLSREVREAVSEGGLGTGGVPVDDVLEAVSVLQELLVLNIVILVAVDKGHSVDLGLIDLEAKGVEDLAEDLGGDLERAQGVTVLEEALGIEAILADNLSEVVDNLLTECTLISIGLASAIHCVDTGLTHRDVNIALETLRREDLINSVRELSPLDVLTLLRRLKDSAEELELAVRDGHLGHVEPNAELGGCNVARAQTVEISEEFGDADALLLA